ncbi:hypothetical protein MBLNU457_g2915t1 [Dothideomycetes sp. NU457]
MNPQSRKLIKQSMQPEARLEHILQGLSQTHKTDLWKTIFEGTSRTEWARQILALIPAPLGRLLAASSPPNPAELKCIEWKDTNCMGVYAWILTRRVSNPIYLDDYLYIGSATNYRSGLSGRKEQHLQKYGSVCRVMKQIVRSGLSRKGHFVTLVSLDNSVEPETVLEARCLMIMIETVLTIWLGALTPRKGQDDQRERLKIRELCPWTLEQVKFIGSCSHVALVVDPNLRKKLQQPCPDTSIDEVEYMTRI